MLQNKRLSLSVLLAAILAVVFWTQSRVPALNEKAQMGLRTQFNEIAFDIVLPVAAEQSFLERVARSSVNWAWTNWKGMTFGLLFAAAALLILGSVRRRSFANPWLNTLFGAAAGAPLGVCVNCATPIAQGIWSAGARMESALGTLIASPTLNIIVVTMSFAILPWEIATAKLIGVAAVLLCLPLLVRAFVSQSTSAPDSAAALRVDTSTLPDMHTGETFAAALRGVSRDYLRHLWYIVKLAVPLMLLAGVLGAFVVEVMPFDFFAATPASVGLIVLAALVATLLPVPIAFDVIAVSALLAAGADAGLATAVLFALGTYSIYPALVIAKDVSVKLSAAMAALVAGVALVLALATQGYSAAGVETQRLIIAQGLTEDARAAYSQAMSICSQLDAALHERCFTEQFDKFSSYVEQTQLCRERPEGLEEDTCDRLVLQSAIVRKATQSRDAAACRGIDAAPARAQCEFTVALQSAVDAHDVEECGALSDREQVANCRAQYVSSSLLFNPDDSVCANLSGGELIDCRTNARVYRLAETLDFAGCAAFRTNDQREFCSYVIASSMIGRQNDPSGCARLSSVNLLQRCNSQVAAWQAERERSLEQCALVVDPSIRATCQLRIAELKIDALLAEATVTSRIDTQDVPDDLSADAMAIPATAPAFAWQTLHEEGALSVRSTNLQRGARTGNRQFLAVPAAELGIASPWNFRSTDFFEPFIVGKGVASGDFNSDGWPDLVFAGDSGVVVYQNTGGRFAPAPLAQGALADKHVFLVAFVDANNDTYPDIFATTYGGSNYLLVNVDSGFAEAQLIELPGNRRLTFAAGFGDLDGNGRLDIVQGNWTSGVERLFSPDESANEILYAEEDHWRLVHPPEVVGESLSVLVSDIDMDADLDVLVANDRIVPDMHYVNDGNGTLRLVDTPTGALPLTSMFTMSIDVADFNNDLRPDLFSSDMTFARSSYDSYCAALDAPEERSRCEALLESYEGLRDGNPLVCSAVESHDERRDCFMAFAVQAAKDLKDASYCERLPANAQTARSLCRLLASPVPPEEAIDQSAWVRQVQRNTLLIGTEDGFVEQAEALGVASSFWSWNARAADLDNDSWQDIYIGNGFHFGDSFYEIQQNVLFRNLGGERFEENAAAWGLDDPLNTPSYTYIDFDRDGDLDIVATGVLAPPRVFVNEEQEHGSLLVQLEDERGNSAAIGALVTIGYGGAQALHQRREIHLSGGFLSFDEPVAHFGLDRHAAIDWIEIRWPDGAVDRYEAAITANTWLKIRRRNTL